MVDWFGLVHDGDGILYWCRTINQVHQCGYRVTSDGHFELSFYFDEEEIEEDNSWFKDHGWRFDCKVPVDLMENLGC